MRKNKRVKKEALEVDITSLLDILVILLVFLLKSYNATNLNLNVEKNLKLANSTSQELGSHATIVQVDKSGSYYVDGKSVKELLPVLKEKAEKEIKLLTKKQTKKVKNPRLAVNLVFDKKLPYKKIQRVMHTAATAGFSKFKFIVQGKGQ